MPSRSQSRKAEKLSPGDSTAAFEKLLKQAPAAERYVLKLYVSGTTPRSTQAIANIRSLCEEHLAGRYDLEVIDIYQQPQAASGAQIIAAPTLVKNFPMPPKRLVGDLSDREKVLIGLDVHSQRAGASRTRWVAL